MLSPKAPLGCDSFSDFCVFVISIVLRSPGQLFGARLLAGVCPLFFSWLDEGVGVWEQGCRGEVPSRCVTKRTRCQRGLRCWCWLWPPGWGHVCQVSPCRGPVSGGQSLGAARPYTTLRAEYRHNLCLEFCMEDVSFLPNAYVFIPSFLLVWVHGYLFYTLGCNPVLLNIVAHLHSPLPFQSFFCVSQRSLKKQASGHSHSSLKTLHRLPTALGIKSATSRQASEWSGPRLCPASHQAAQCLPPPALVAVSRLPRVFQAFSAISSFPITLIFASEVLIPQRSVPSGLLSLLH